MLLLLLLLVLWLLLLLLLPVLLWLFGPIPGIEERPGNVKCVKCVAVGSCHPPLSPHPHLHPKKNGGVGWRCWGGGKDGRVLEVC